MVATEALGLLQRHRQRLVSLLAAALAAALAYRALAGGAEAAYVVAARDLGPHERLDGAAVRVVRGPASARHPEALSSVGEAVGRFTRQRLVAGEALLRHHLSDYDRQSRIAASLAPGQRAIFVPTSAERGLGGAVRADDRVDLIFVPDAAGAAGPAPARTVLARLPVLDVRREPPDEFGGEPAIAGITVAVSAAEAEQVAWSLERGSVYVALNGYAEAAAEGGGER